MNMKQLTSPLMFLGLATSLLFAAGCPEDEESCTTADDCLSGEICNADGSCEAPSGPTTCTDDTTCTADNTFCLPSADDATVNVCRTPTNCGEAPATERVAYCESTLQNFDPNTQSASCNAANECVASDRLENVYIQILDGSTNATSCGSTNDDNSMSPVTRASDAGSDIMWVRLKSADGSVLAWGQAVRRDAGETDPAGGTVGFGNLSALNGAEPELTANQCPAGGTPATNDALFGSETVIALGCGGSLFVKFDDGEGNDLLIEPGMMIEVAEYATAVCNGTAPNAPASNDVYSVYLCATPMNTDADDIADTDCSIELAADVKGINESTVPAAE